MLFAINFQSMRLNLNQEKTHTNRLLTCDLKPHKKVNIIRVSWWIEVSSLLVKCNSVCLQQPYTNYNIRYFQECVEYIQISGFFCISFPASQSTNNCTFIPLYEPFYWCTCSSSTVAAAAAVATTKNSVHPIKEQRNQFNVFRIRSCKEIIWT